MGNIDINQKIALNNYAGPEKSTMQSHESVSIASTMGERLRLLRSKLGLTQSEAARKFGILLTTWKKYEAGPSEPGSGALRGLADGGVNINWLLKGEGEMLLNSDDPQQRQDPYHARSYDLGVFDDGKKRHSDQAFSDRMGVSPATLDDFALVPVYDPQASAGRRSCVESAQQTGHLAFRKDWLRDKGLQVKHLAVITAKGDSMEPTISDGDILLIDTSIDKIVDDTLYILQADHHLIVKRIQQALDGTLIIISDNQRYEKQTIAPDRAKEVKIAGRVKWYGHGI